MYWLGHYHYTNLLGLHNVTGLSFSFFNSQVDWDQDAIKWMNEPLFGNRHEWNSWMGVCNSRSIWPQNGVLQPVQCSGYTPWIQHCIVLVRLIKIIIPQWSIWPELRRWVKQSASRPGRPIVWCVCHRHTTKMLAAGSTPASSSFVSVTANSVTGLRWALQMLWLHY